MPAAKAIIDSFWDHMEPEPNSGCWLWFGAKNSRRYGNLRGLPAHRVGYELLVGPVPPGRQLDHLCRNRACVNPGHLDIVTARTNCLRGIGPAGLNSRKMACPKGHALRRVARSDRSSGAKRSCRECPDAYQKAWTQRNRTRLREYRTQWRERRNLIVSDQPGITVIRVGRKSL